MTDDARAGSGRETEKSSFHRERMAAIDKELKAGRIDERQARNMRSFLNFEVLEPSEQA